MNYFLLILILAICGGAYYEHTLDQQKNAADQQQISDRDAQIANLQTNLQTLTDDKAKLAKSLADAQAKLTALSPQPAAVATGSPAPTSAAPGAAPSAPSTANATAPGAAPAQLSKDQMTSAVVLIKGDNAEGTGFLVKTADGPAIVTNLHVISDNPNLKITTINGVEIKPTGLKGAKDRDLAMFAIQDAGYTYLPLATNLSSTVQVGDEVLTPGNSQGGGVVLSTSGKVVAIGPDRIEFDNPIYHGNSGGPVFHTKSGTVLGVVAEAMKVDVTNDFDKTSFQSRSSAITGSVRYFGLRLDTVTQWEPYDQQLFAKETAFLDEFNKTSRCLDCYMNPPSAGASANGEDAKFYLNNDKIVAANDNFLQQVGGNSTASARLDALKQLVFDLNTVAGQDMASMQNMNNFYSFDQQRAKDELAYRKALQTEIDDFSNDVSRVSSLPRSN